MAEVVPANSAKLRTVPIFLPEIAYVISLNFATWEHAMCVNFVVRDCTSCKQSKCCYLRLHTWLVPVSLYEVAAARRQNVRLLCRCRVSWPPHAIPATRPTYNVCNSSATCRVTFFCKNVFVSPLITCYINWNSLEDFTCRSSSSVIMKFRNLYKRTLENACNG